jgi:hypothetical protein
MIESSLGALGRLEMKSMMKFFGVVALALTMPLFAGTASAAEAVTAAPVTQSLTGAVAHNTGLVAKADTGEKIVVAHRRGRWVGPAIVGGVALGLALGAANRAEARDRHYDARVGQYEQCREWNYRCRRGGDGACYKFDRYCD